MPVKQDVIAEAEEGGKIFFLTGLGLPWKLKAKRGDFERAKRYSSIIEIFPGAAALL